MFRFVSNLFGNRKSKPARRSAPTFRRAQLGVESLEGRVVPSASPIFAAGLQAAQLSQVTHITGVYVPPHVVDVTNLTGVTFTLASSTPGKPTHTLSILTETYNANGSANITASWQGDGPNAKTITGTLKFNAQGNLAFTGTWTNGQGGTNTLTGTITKVVGHIVYSYHYHFSGKVTVTGGGGGGPGSVSGNSANYLLFTLPISTREAVQLI